MKSDDTDNYGTPFSYATDRENNEVVSKDRLYRIQGAITTYRSLLIVWNPDTHTPIRAILLQPLCARMTYSRDGGARVGGVRSKVE